jgi:hypothetical protein
MRSNAEMKSRQEQVPMMVDVDDCSMLLDWAKGRKGAQAEMLRELLRLTKARAEARRNRYQRAA